MKTIQSKQLAYRLFFLLATLVTLSSCDVLRDLTTEPTTTTTRTTTTPTSETEATTPDAGLRNSIVSFAKKQEGVKYKYAGNSPREGFDCSGLTRYVMNEFDIEISRTSRSQANEGKLVDIKKAQAGDLVFFKRSKSEPVFHVALILSNNASGLKVIHSTSRGVVIENISQNSYWKPKIYTARQVISG